MPVIVSVRNVIPSGGRREFRKSEAGGKVCDRVANVRTKTRSASRGRVVSHRRY